MIKTRSKSTKYASSCRRIDSKFEAFLAQQLGGADLVDFYDLESCVQDLKDQKIPFKKFSFKLLVVCRDRIYILDNPPTNLSSYILYDEIEEIKTVTLRL